MVRGVAKGGGGGGGGIGLQISEKNLFHTFPGEFGVVWKGHLQTDEKECTVAVKCLRVRRCFTFMTFSYIRSPKGRVYIAMY